MKRFLKLYSIEQKMFFRSGDVILFNLIMPVVTFILIASIAGNKDASESLTFLQSSYPSLITVGICCSAFMSIPIVLVDYRDKKVLKSFYCSPCSPKRLLGITIISSGILATISAVIITLVAVIGFNYRMDGNVFAFIGAWLLTLVSMFSIGLLIASLCKSVKSMNIVTSIVYLPMLFLSGATVPYEILPNWLKVISDVMPLSLGIKMMKEISIGSFNNCLYQSIILSVITVIGIVVSIKTFKWE